MKVEDEFTVDSGRRSTEPERNCPCFQVANRNLSFQQAFCFLVWNYVYVLCIFFSRHAAVDDKIHTHPQTQYVLVSNLSHISTPHLSLENIGEVKKLHVHVDGMFAFEKTQVSIRPSV